MSRTVRDVLDAFVDRTLEAALASDHEIADRGKLLSGCLAELRDVLSTGDQWVTRDVPADQIAAGDVIADKRGRLWAVTLVQRIEGTPPDLAVDITRAGTNKVARFAPDQPVPTLLTRTDARALALLEARLGAEAVGRGTG